MHLGRLLLHAHTDVSLGCPYEKGLRYVTVFSPLQSQHKVSVNVRLETSQRVNKDKLPV